MHKRRIPFRAVSSPPYWLGSICTQYLISIHRFALENGLEDILVWRSWPNCYPQAESRGIEVLRAHLLPHPDPEFLSIGHWKDWGIISRRESHPSANDARLILNIMLNWRHQSQQAEQGNVDESHGYGFTHTCSFSPWWVFIRDTQVTTPAYHGLIIHFACAWEDTAVTG